MICLVKTICKEATTCCNGYRLFSK